MELTDLKMIMVIMKEGNITRAAEKLDYVQSNITMRVRKLEQELGVQLFHRHTKGVEPTEKGRLFCQYAADILRMVDEATRAVQDQDQPCGPLRIGVVETITSSAPFIRALIDFQSRCPEVSLSLETGTSPSNYEKVANRELDGAFCTGEYDLSQMQVGYEVQEQIFLLTNALAQEAPASSELANAAWVVFPVGCPIRAANEDWLLSEGVPHLNKIEVSTLDTMLNCVRAGIGYALVTNTVVARDDDLVHVHPVPELYRFVTTRLIARKEPFQNKAFDAFAACVRAAGGEA
ncbi:MULTISPECIES: LysR family transcriptional regulator [Paenibacillus]|uniref:LysR family transcriptional regulator n=1 Tax=Paenibacillus TaxID=44249 RepID=UPI0022B8DA55|nr:LysR family transcriptional regulator [Paenibacillus caseinilyticus]MCZ8519733.1 LysR family transcriptional regulator [Paenibacillus caseinilyticus]